MTDTAGDSSWAVETRGLAKRFGSNVAVNGVDLRIPRGCAFGYLGPNGAGKGARRPAARAGLELRPDLPTLLVTGGSQGAQRINQAVFGAQRALAEAGIQVLHITGPKNLQPAPERAPDEPPYRVLPYLEEMAAGYAAADLVLCRSGAMTCAELTAVGLPAGYVPLPLRGAEQRLNAEPIVAAGGGLLVADADCTPDWVATELVALLTDPTRLASMAEAAGRHGTRAAAGLLAERVLEAAGDR